MITFIEGSAVLDVSGKMREKLCETLSNSDKNVFLIVPEQFEFETEKSIYSMLSKRGLLTELCRVNVTTFSSLSRDILIKSGEDLTAADDIIKTIVMNKAVREEKNALTALNGAADKSGFCERMIKTISALKTAGLSAEDIDGESGLFPSDGGELGMDLIVRKLSDVGRIFRSYNDMLSKYTDSLDYTKKASELIAKKDSEFFKDSRVFVDCFNDFTGSQLEFIRRMTAKAESTVFALVADTINAPRENLFGRIFAQRDRIRDFAEKEGIETEIITENIEKRLDGPLGELSENIFGNGKSSADPSGVCELVSARDVYEEADYIAAKIKSLCLDGGLLYRDTAVLCADAGNGKYIRNALEKYEIPFFLDIPEPILYQPLVSFFVSLLNALKNFTADNVLSCLKTGFYSKPDKDGAAAVSNKDIDVFENYVFEWNLSAKHLKKEFKFADANDPSQIDAEKIRKAVAEPILKLREELKNKDGSQITRLLYDFAVNNVGIERALRARCYDKSGGETAFDADALRVNQQVWNSIAEILGALETELSGVNITLEEYCRLFTEICSGTTLAKPPQFCDCVLVGDISRTRADGVKAVFIAGASYETLPSVPSGMGVFSEYEAERITDIIRKNTSGEDTRSVSLMGFKEQYSLSLYRTYRAISLPTEFLCISCPQYDASGNQISRSTVFKDIARVFPEIKTIKAEDMDEMFYCRSLKAVKQRYSVNLGSAAHSQGVMRAYLEESGNGGFVKKLGEIREKRGSEKSSAHRLSENTAKQLFKSSLGKPNGSISIGATQIEKLTKCPFSFFCSKELGVREIKKREFNSSNRGNAMHYIMEQVFIRYKDNMDEFFKLGRSDFLALAGEFISEFLKNETNGDIDDDKRTNFLFNNIAGSAADLLVTMQTELSIRSYQPQFFELNISNEAKNTFSLDTDEYNGDISENENTSQTENKQDEPKKPTEFELYLKPLSIKLGDNTEILVGGYVDRLDVMYAKNGGEPRLYLRVIDYKSRAKTFETENAKNGANIQMLLYLKALCDANSDNKTANVLPGEISYVSSQNAGAAKTRQEALYLIEIKHHPNTFYISDEIIKNNLKKMTEKIISEINESISESETQSDAAEKIHSTFALNDNNSLTRDDFKKFSEECVENVKNKISGIYGGDVSAVPLVYKETDCSGDKPVVTEQMPCRFCDFSGICGYTADSR